MSEFFRAKATASFHHIQSHMHLVVDEVYVFLINALPHLGICQIGLGFVHNNLLNTNCIRFSDDSCNTQRKTSSSGDFSSWEKRNRALVNEEKYKDYFRKWKMSVMFRITFEYIQFKRVVCVATTWKIIWWNEWKRRISFLFRCVCLLMQWPCSLFAIERKTCTGNFYHKVFWLLHWSLPLWLFNASAKWKRTAKPVSWNADEGFKRLFNGTKIKRMEQRTIANILWFLWKKDPSTNWNLMDWAGHSHLNSP